MKKRTKIALAVAAILLAVGATLCNIARGRGESLLSLLQSGGMSVSSGQAQIGDRQKGYTVCLTGEESFSTDDVRSLTLEWISGSVEVEPWDGDTVVVREEAAEPLTEDQRLRWKLVDGGLRVLCCANGETKLPDKRLTVLVPRADSLVFVDTDAVSASIRYSDLHVSTDLDAASTSGEILVRGCEGLWLDIDTTSGAVTVEETSVKEEIDLDTTSGDIAVHACSCSVFDADTVSGAVRAEELAVGEELNVDTGGGAVELRALAARGSVDVDTISGRVLVQMSAQPREVDVDTTSGAVALSLPKGTTVDLSFDTASGRLSGMLSSAPGGIPVDVDTVSGDLTIGES